ncbi:unnamed protein product [Amoebophrya sp. A120]|nr:unnamed protein product [Amoebophrya sp. A120]|eukprot:GSA120T00003739001.1
MRLVPYLLAAHHLVLFLAPAVSAAGGGGPLSTTRGVEQDEEAAAAIRREQVNFLQDAARRAHLEELQRKRLREGEGEGRGRSGDSDGPSGVARVSHHSGDDKMKVELYNTTDVKTASQAQKTTGISNSDTAFVDEQENSVNVELVLTKGSVGEHATVRTKMTVPNSVYDTTHEEQRREARKHYETKGFAFLLPALSVPLSAGKMNGSGTGSLNIPGVVVEDDADDLSRLAQSEEWGNWVRKMVVESGLTRLPPEQVELRDQSQPVLKMNDVSWLAETSPAARVWNEVLDKTETDNRRFSSSKEIKRMSTDEAGTGTSSEPQSHSLGWAGAGLDACTTDDAAFSTLEFYTKCPPSLWDSVGEGATAVGEVKRRKSIQELVSDEEDAKLKMNLPAEDGKSQRSSFFKMKSGALKTYSASDGVDPQNRAGLEHLESAHAHVLSYDRALVLSNTFGRQVALGDAAATDRGAKQAEQEERGPFKNVLGALSTVHADVTLENTATGTFQSRYQTVSSLSRDDDSDRFFFPNLSYGTGFSVLGHYHALGSVAGALKQEEWGKLFSEPKIGQKIGVEICGLQKDDFDFFAEAFYATTAPDNAFLADYYRSAGAAKTGLLNWALVAVFLHKLHKIEMEAIPGFSGKNAPRVDENGNNVEDSPKQEVADVLEKLRKYLKERFFPRFAKEKQEQVEREGAAARFRATLEEFPAHLREADPARWEAYQYYAARMEEEEKNAAQTVLTKSHEVLAEALPLMSEETILEHVLQFMSVEQMEQWACFFGRLRVHDAYNVWVNLTPAEEGADPTMPRAIQKPLAVLDPFTMGAGQSKSHSMVYPDYDAWTEDAVEGKNKWYVRPKMYFGEVLWFNTNVSYHTAVDLLDSPNDQNAAKSRRSIESRVLVIDTCLKKFEGGGSGGALQHRSRDHHDDPEEASAGQSSGSPDAARKETSTRRFSLEDIRRECWGKKLLQHV